MSDLDIFKTYAVTLSDSDLARAWRILYNEYTARGEKNAVNLRYTLGKGDSVEWNDSRRPSGIITGTIVRVKRKKAIVAENFATGKPDPGTRWDIPLAMLRKI